MDFLTQKTKKLLIVSVMLIAAAGIIILLLSGSDSGPTPSGQPDDLIKLPGTPLSRSQRKLVVEDFNQNLHLIKNKIDGYSIKIPKGWQIPEEAGYFGGVTFSKDISPEGEEQTESPEEDHDHGIHNVLFLEISTKENSLNEDVASWLNNAPEAAPLRSMYVDSPSLQKISIAGAPAYKAEKRPHWATGTAGSAIPNTQVAEYFFRYRDKVFVVSCTVASENLQERMRECEDIITSFRTIKPTYSEKITQNNPLLQRLPYQSPEFDIYAEEITDTDEAHYLVYLKTERERGENGYQLERSRLADQAKQWIRDRDINPENLKIRLTTENPEFFIPQN